MSALKELRVGGGAGRCPAAQAERLFSLAPLPFSCRALVYLDVYPLYRHRQVLAAFYRSMCDAVLDGRASASHSLFPALRVLVAVQTGEGDEDDAPM